MPPPHNGNAPIPFAELMKLDKVDENTFRSIALPHCPGGQLPRAVGVTYGGHVFSQAAWAACQTVKDELLLYVCMSCAPRKQTVHEIVSIVRARRSVS